MRELVIKMKLNWN